MTRDVVRSDAQHKLPPYLRHAPDRIESLERVLDDETIDEVLSLPQLGSVLVLLFFRRHIVDPAVHEKKAD